jgi:hypothetical protein
MRKTNEQTIKNNKFIKMLKTLKYAFFVTPFLMIPMVGAQAAKEIVKCPLGADQKDCACELENRDLTYYGRVVAKMDADGTKLNCSNLQQHEEDKDDDTPDIEPNDFEPGPSPSPDHTPDNTGNPFG